MAKNRIAAGRVLDWTNGTGAAVAVGALVVIGTLVGVVLSANDGTASVANGKAGTVSITGAYEIAKLGTDVVAQGAKLYWDSGNSRLTTTVGANTLAGVAHTAAGNGVATVYLLLNGLPD